MLNRRDILKNLIGVSLAQFVPQSVPLAELREDNMGYLQEFINRPREFRFALVTVEDRHIWGPPIQSAIRVKDGIRFTMEPMLVTENFAFIGFYFVSPSNFKRAMSRFSSALNLCVGDTLKLDYILQVGL